MLLLHRWDIRDLLSSQRNTWSTNLLQLFNIAWILLIFECLSIVLIIPFYSHIGMVGPWVLWICTQTCLVGTHLLISLLSRDRLMLLQQIVVHHLQFDVLFLCWFCRIFLDGCFFISILVRSLIKLWTLWIALQHSFLAHLSLDRATHYRFLMTLLHFSHLVSVCLHLMLLICLGGWRYPCHVSRNKTV